MVLRAYCSIGAVLTAHQAEDDRAIVGRRDRGFGRWHLPGVAVGRVRRHGEDVLR